MKPLILNKVSKNFGKLRAVNEISLEADSGEIFGLLGGNGAGKTTTMRMVLGIILPDGGEIYWKGKKYSKTLQQMMGYLPEERGLYPKVKVSDQIQYLAKLRGMSGRKADRELKKWLERFDVPEYYSKKIEELSKGNQQKIQFIAAIIHRPDILVLDEAFSGLDPVNVELMKATVKELRDNGTTILFSTHRMEHVEELCQNICILYRSNSVLQGSLKEIKGKFPKEKVRLQTQEAIRNWDAFPEVEVLEERDDHDLTLKIPRVAMAQDLLHFAANQTAVLRFEVLEPTLNEIFIRAVGEKHA